MLFFQFISLIFSIPNDCKPGIIYSDRRNSFYYIINESYFNENNLWDPILQGSFCPFLNGKYRLIYEGSIDSTYDSTVSRFYFNGTLIGRISNFFNLSNKICYSYYMLPASGKTYAWGKVTFEFENGEKILSTNLNTYNCLKTFCKNNSTSLINCNLSSKSKIYKNKFIFLLLNLIL